MIMEIRTKYDLRDYLYFIHKRQVRYAMPSAIETSMIEVDGEEIALVINYIFKVEKGKPLVEKGQNEVFKRRADLIRSL